MDKYKNRKGTQQQLEWPTLAEKADPNLPNEKKVKYRANIRQVNTSSLTF